jgi:hypothetical protein
MPSHIFTRVGYWNESIDANSRSAKAAKEGKDPSEQLHADDYMVYALLQLAQDSRASDVIADMIAINAATWWPRRLCSHRARPRHWSRRCCHSSIATAC